ncbi:response regulator [Geoglobus acetivorans]|uniref:Signal transduction response regulator n=1 Tax=Geoglobus acetivorans TaxID=565033 RepID=A0A0A7GG29_GEOAI|nr:Signal transduction response regulator [Geoglobus acetivorans]
MKLVLVVEDDDAVLEVIKAMLGDRYSVLEARDGKEAVEKYRVFRPNIVLMDVVMPEMDGVEATREIKRMDPNAKIIGVTAYAKQRAKDLLEAGALEVVEKPFSKSTLVSTIEKYIENS